MTYETEITLPSSIKAVKISSLAKIASVNIRDISLFALSAVSQ